MVNVNFSIDHSPLTYSNRPLSTFETPSSKKWVFLFCFSGGRVFLRWDVSIYCII